MRSLAPIAIASLTLLLAGCGGGGGGGSLGAPLGLQGLVVTRDGSPTNLGGVRITCPEGGGTTTTGRGGQFALDVPRGVVLHLEVEDPLAPDDDGDAPDCDESDDGSVDGSDIAGGSVELDALGEDETCGVEIELVDGKVVDVRVTKEKGGGGSRKESGEGVLRPVEGSGLEAYGEVEVGASEACSWAELEVRGLPVGRYDVVLVAPGGAEETIGAVEIDGKSGHFAIESCGGDRRLPFDVGAVADLAGYTVEVRDADARVLLRGEVPAVGADDVKDDDDKDDDGVKDDGDDDEQGGDGEDRD